MTGTKLTYWSKSTGEKNVVEIPCVGGPDAEPDLWRDVEAYDAAHGTNLYDDIDDHSPMDMEELPDESARVKDLSRLEGPVAFVKHVSTTGNSLSVVIPSNIVMQLGLHKGDKVLMTIERI